MSKQAPSSAIPGLLSSILGDLACFRTNPALLVRLPVFLQSKGLTSARQAALVRDIVRGPFRPLRFNSSWKTWSSGVCVRIAKGVYQEQMFDRLPILADALEEAGCTEPEILDHCRSPGEHYRGCWVVDLMLGKS